MKLSLSSMLIVLYEKQKCILTPRQVWSFVLTHTENSTNEKSQCHVDCQSNRNNTALMILCIMMFRLGTDLISLVSSLLLFFLLGKPLQNKPKAPSFQIWSGLNLTGLFFKYICIDWQRVRFLTCCHTFKMAAMTSILATKCCHLVSEHESPMHQHASVPDL